MKKSRIEITYQNGNHSDENRKRRIIRRIFISGIFSLILLLIILYTLPMTVLSFSSLLEYSIIVALVIFLVILLVRYFAILVLAYLNLNKYTFKPKDNFKPFVSIIIPAYNEGKLLEGTVKSLLELDYADYEIIIVNDGSTDNTKEVAEKLVGYRKGVYNKIKISLISKPNSGKAIALNSGIKLSRADFVLCMDGDSQLSKDSIKMGIRHFADPEIGAVAGNVKVLNRGSFFTDLQALE